MPIKRDRLDTDISEDVSFVRLQLLEDGWVITNHFEINDLETILRNSASFVTHLLFHLARPDFRAHTLAVPEPLLGRLEVAARRFLDLGHPL